MTAAAGSEPQPDLLECVINVSEGRDAGLLEHLGAAAGPYLLDVHRDAHHHRAVLTLGGDPPGVEAAVQALATETVARLDLRGHQGVHPRIGVLDVVPWCHLRGWPVVDGDLDVAVEARDRFCTWAAATLGLPCFAYGPERSLPEVRRRAFRDLAPTAGPAAPHPTAGAAAVGARPVLVAYNLWLAEPDLAAARRVASALRGPHLRTLALPVGDAVQVSCNLIAPWALGPAAVHDAVASEVPVERAELVGLLPRTLLEAIPRHRYGELDVDPSRTIEARLERAGLDGGSFAVGPGRRLGRPARRPSR